MTSQLNSIESEIAFPYADCSEENVCHDRYKICQKQELECSSISAWCLVHIRVIVIHWVNLTCWYTSRFDVKFQPSQYIIYFYSNSRFIGLFLY